MSHSPDDARARDPAWVAGALIGALVLAGACTSVSVPSPSPSSPSVTPSPATPTPTATSPAATPTSTITASAPALLLTIASGGEAGVWRLQGGVRERVGLPAGDWSVTAGSHFLGLVSRTQPTKVLVGHLSAGRFVADWQVDLPAGAAAAPFVACLSAAGQVVLADDRADLSVLSRTGRLQPLPAQKDNLGSCAWLDERYLIRDQEDRTFMILDEKTGATVAAAGLRGRVPSVAAQRLAYLDDARDAAVVTTFTIGTHGFQPGSVLRSAQVPGPATAAISPDGAWLLVTGLEGGSVFSIVQGLVPQGRVPLAGGDAVGWLPAGP